MTAALALTAVVKGRLRKLTTDYTSLAGSLMQPIRSNQGKVYWANLNRYFDVPQSENHGDNGTESGTGGVTLIYML